MTDGIQVYSAIKVQQDQVKRIEQPVSEESPVTIYLNGKEIVTMLCTPYEEKYLALGFLISEGMISNIDHLSQLTVDSERGLVWAEADIVVPNAGNMYLKRCLTACCGRGRAEFYFSNDARVTKLIDSTYQIEAKDIHHYAKLLECASVTHSVTHGVHSGAIAANGNFMFYSEDIGRHNIFDKLYGRCLEKGLRTDDKVIVFSGRVSSEILLKVNKMGVPIVIARSVPTTLSLSLADELGVTLVGCAKGESFTVYTHSYRVIGL